MKRFLVLGALLSVVLMAASAFAYEFSVTGKYDWDTEYGAQTGTNGFFGKFDQDNLNAGRDANLNFWFGRRGIVSGSDAIRQRQKFYLNPQFRICDAIRIRGVYKVGGAVATQMGTVVTGAPIASPSGTLANGGTYPNGFGIPNGVQYAFADTSYDNSRLGGTDVAFALGEWTQLWATAQFPFGILAIGKRPFTFGNGIILNGEEVTTSESALLSVPYGPLTLLAGGYFKAAGTRYVPWTNGGINLVDSATAASTPYAADQWPYNRPWDASSQLQEFGLGVVYRAGSLETGVLALYDTPLHFGPEYRRTTLARRVAQTSIDQANFWGVAYMKYSNCRFFLNGDFGWFSSMLKLSGPPGVVGVGGGGAAPLDNRPNYVDHYSYMVETGAIVGPSKLSLFYMHRPGNDRRLPTAVANGVYDGGMLLNNPVLAPTGLTRPYSFLLGWTYGSGIGAIDSNGHGYFNDATVIAARLDYAVAANLNVWGSALYAERASVSGYSFGCLTAPVGDPTIGGVLTPWVLTQAGDNNAATIRTWRAGDAPTNLTGAYNIPDPSLGYEFGVGTNWKLLEGYTWNIQGNYWIPGKWFSYACQDKSLPAGAAALANFWRTNPNRDIDPVVSIYSNFVLSF